MKHHAHTLIYLACLASAWLMCSCRSTLQNIRSTQEQSNLSITDSALRIRTEDTYSRFNLNQEQTGKDWKVKVNFDTTKSADLSTGLPPISNIEIEGSKTTIKTLLQKDDTTRISDKQETTTDVTFQQNKQSESQKNASGSIADGIDDGFKYGLIIGIPILLIILILPFYAKYRQKNPSK